jgi:phosphoadenosine phosphosulfate reductase
MLLSSYKLEKFSQEFETKTPQEIIEWTVDRYAPYVAMSSSFQTQSMPLLHIISQIAPDIPIFFINTGYHFWETLMFREKIAEDWKLNIVDLYRDSRWDVFVRQRMRTLPAEDPNLCCFLHKVVPMQNALKGYKAWITGIRRDQTSVRAQASILEMQGDGLLKVNPLLNWTKKDVQKYIEEHNLPKHPLFEKGYRSIGCAPCTIAIGVNDDERAGRWAGKGKVECGLHTEMFRKTDIEDSKTEFHTDLTGMDAADKK